MGAEANGLVANSQRYYGSQLKTSSDLKTSACTSSCAPPKAIRPILKQIPSEVSDKFYGPLPPRHLLLFSPNAETKRCASASAGCGSPIPQGIEGMRVLDLGSGSGRDAYVLAKLVGSSGHVVGIDITDEQIAIADKWKHQWCVDTLGMRQPNMTFVKGQMEDLKAAGIEQSSFDLIVSNCVINLSPDKQAVLDGSYRALKPGGELHFADVYSDRRVPPHLLNHPILHGEGLAGALYVSDFKHMAQHAGFQKPLALNGNVIQIYDQDLSALLGPNITYYSITFRVFKLPGYAEVSSEDYGFTVVYKGTYPENEYYFQLDERHIFETDRPVRVDGNIAAATTKSWLSKHFDVLSGSFDTHYGAFGACDNVPNIAKKRNKGLGGSAVGESCCS